MIVELPNNESATLRDYNELTERSARRIRAALRAALEQMSGLMVSGFDETKPDTWTALKDLSDEQTAIEVYQDRCIVEMVKGWTLGDLPTMETVGDLPAETYAILAEQAVNATRDDEDFSVDGAADPKVDTGDSAG
jgi:AcrR family transcriptional regulator